MFGLARRYVKTSIIYFVMGLTIGMWILLAQTMGYGVPAMLISAHTHLTLYGFVITLIMGVAYWMFPRPAKEDYRYSPNMAEVNYWLITIGTAIRTAGEISSAYFDVPAARYGILLGAAMQLAGGLVFSWNIWSRIRPIGSQQREARGEKF